MIKYFKIMLIILLTSQAIQCSEWDKNMAAFWGAGISVPLAAGMYPAMKQFPYPTAIMFSFTALFIGFMPILKKTGPFINKPMFPHYHYGISIVLLAFSLGSFAYEHKPN